MKKIDTTSWKEFRVGELFTIIGGKGITKQEIYEHPGSLPAIQSGEENFGCIGYIDKDYCVKQKYTISKGECLTVARSGSSGYVGYQASQCVVGDSAKILEPKFEANTLRLLFVRSTLMVLKAKYAYTDKVTNENYAKAIILLPAKNNAPDWQYMEDYMRNVEFRVQSSISALKGAENNRLKIDHSYWKDFLVGDLFEISRPSARLATEFEEGDTPFVASGNENNGVEKYVNAKEIILDKKGCISVSPVDGSCFFQPVDFIGRGGAGSSIILLRNDNMKSYNALYICSVLRRVCSKYNYSNMGSASSIKDEKILLPATPSGIPDWHYMEMYMRGVEAIVKNKLSLLIPHKSEVAIKDAANVTFNNATVTYIDQSKTYNVK